MATKAGRSPTDAQAPRWLNDRERETWLAFIFATRLFWEEVERDLQRDSQLPFGYYEILVMLSHAEDRTLRMNELAGALLEVQVGRLPGIVEATRRLRDQIVAVLREALPDLPLRPVPDPAGEVPTAVGFYLEDADLATRVAGAITAEGVPARKVYGGRPVYANPSILHQRTISSTGRPFTDPLYLSRGPKMEYDMGMCPRSEDYLGRCVVVGISPLMTEADAEDVVTAVEKVMKALA